MKISAKYIPADIKQRYKLQDKIIDGYIYIKIKRGMYGLKQAAILAHEQLVANLKPFAYHPIPNTNFWKHTTRPTIFCLCVDDFGIKYYSKADADHLFSALAQHYQYTVDWKGTHFCGYEFNWHYDDGFVDVSMPTSVPTILKNSIIVFQSLSILHMSLSSSLLAPKYDNLRCNLIPPHF